MTCPRRYAPLTATLLLILSCAPSSQRGPQAADRRGAGGDTVTAPQAEQKIAAAAVRAFPPPQRVTFEYSPFGLHAAGDGETEARELGVHLVRRIVLWQELEPRPGDLKIEGGDSYVRQVQSAGLDPVITIRPVSKWAVNVDYDQLKREKPNRPWTLFSGPPRQMDQWLNIVQKVVERYDGDGVADMPRLMRPIRYWQIDNEIRWMWQGPLEEYVKLMIQTSQAIRQADPNARIIFGGLTEGLSLAKAGLAQRAGTGLGGRAAEAAAKIEKADRMINQILETAGPHFDIVDFHSYDDEPYGVGLQTAWLRSRIGDSKEIWTLENAGPFEDFTTEAFCADLVKRHTVAFAYGVTGFFWSSLNPTLGWNEPYIRLALLDRQRRKTPAYYTYRILGTKLQGMQSMETISLPPAASVFRARCGERDVYVAWNDGGPREVTLPVETAVDVTHIITDYGVYKPQVERVSAADGKLTLTLSPLPVFIEPVAR